MTADLNLKAAARRNACGFAPARRLKTPSEFTALLRTPRERSIRMVREMLSIDAAWTSESTDGEVGDVRFGVTVGKRNARRSVDRALVKRVVREACRQRAGDLERCARAGSVRVSIALRLKAPLIDIRGEPLAMRRWRRQVRVEADALLQDVLVQMRGRFARPVCA